MAWLSNIVLTEIHKVVQCYIDNRKYSFTFFYSSNDAKLANAKYGAALLFLQNLYPNESDSEAIMLLTPRIREDGFVTPKLSDSILIRALSNFSLPTGSDTESPMYNYAGKFDSLLQYHSTDGCRELSNICYFVKLQSDGSAALRAMYGNHLPGCYDAILFALYHALSYLGALDSHFDFYTLPQKIDTEHDILHNAIQLNIRYLFIFAYDTLLLKYNRIPYSNSKDKFYLGSGVQYIKDLKVRDRIEQNLLCTLTNLCDLSNGVIINHDLSLETLSKLDLILVEIKNELRNIIGIRCEFLIQCDELRQQIVLLSDSCVERGGADKAVSSVAINLFNIRDITPKIAEYANVALNDGDMLTSQFSDNFGFTIGNESTELDDESMERKSSSKSSRL